MDAVGLKLAIDAATKSAHDTMRAAADNAKAQGRHIADMIITQNCSNDEACEIIEALNKATFQWNANPAAQILYVAARDALSEMWIAREQQAKAAR